MNIKNDQKGNEESSILTKFSLPISVTEKQSTSTSTDDIAISKETIEKEDCILDQSWLCGVTWQDLLSIILPTVIGIPSKSAFSDSLSSFL